MLKLFPLLKVYNNDGVQVSHEGGMKKKRISDHLNQFNFCCFTFLFLLQTASSTFSHTLNNSSLSSSTSTTTLDEVDSWMAGVVVAAASGTIGSNDRNGSNGNFTSASNTSGFGDSYEMFYRHSVTMTVLYCIAYFIVFIVGLIGNSFVIAVVFRAPRMRTVTNFFIVNLALADILVIVFCLPATLMSNIFVRK